MRCVKIEEFYIGLITGAAIKGFTFDNPSDLFGRKTNTILVFNPSGKKAES
jgi:hypothetical protein